MSDAPVDVSTLATLARAAQEAQAAVAALDPDASDYFEMHELHRANDAFRYALTPSVVLALLDAASEGARDRKTVQRIDEFYPLDDYHEDYGPVLWWAMPVKEPPYVGTMGDDDFPEYVTHWSRLHIPATPSSPVERDS